MAKHQEALVGYRPGVKVLDATLRDGGLVNNFYFEDEFVKGLYEANLKAGVDYMEFGYKASKDLFDVDAFGKWKFCNDEDIRSIVGDNPTDLKISVMADVGRTDYKTDILKKDESPIDLIRVATYLNTIPAAIDMIEDAKGKGYEVSCNIMAISKVQESGLQIGLDMLCQTPVDVIYIVDSYGALYPEELARVIDVYRDYAEKYNKKIGIHAHNNQQLAFANTLEAVGDGCDWLDATYWGMGRGAGNCPMELLLSLLRNPKYKTYPVIRFIDSYMVDLRKRGVVWGYDLQYFLTGMMNLHPRSAIKFTNKGREDYYNFFQEIFADD